MDELNGWVRTDDGFPDVVGHYLTVDSRGVVRILEYDPDYDHAYGRVFRGICCMAAPVPDVKFWKKIDVPDFVMSEVFENP